MEIVKRHEPLIDSFDQEAIEIPTEGSSNRYAEFYIQDFHGEYEIPTTPSISVREIFDEGQVSDLFTDVGIQNVEEMTRIIYDKRVPKRFRKYFDNEEFEGTVWRVVVWIKPSKIANDQEINNYMDNQAFDGYLREFGAKVFEAVVNASGDDDYYDYMPTFVGIFRQFCLITNRKEIWNQIWAAILAASEKDEEITEAFSLME